MNKIDYGSSGLTWILLKIFACKTEYIFINQIH